MDAAHTHSLVGQTVRYANKGTSFTGVVQRVDRLGRHALVGKPDGSEQWCRVPKLTVHADSATVLGAS
jgi:lipocalin